MLTFPFYCSSVAYFGLETTPPSLEGATYTTSDAVHFTCKYRSCQCRELRQHCSTCCKVQDLCESLFVLRLLCHAYGLPHNQIKWPEMLISRTQPCIWLNKKELYMQSVPMSSKACLSPAACWQDSMQMPNGMRAKDRGFRNMKSFAFSETQHSAHQKTLAVCPSQARCDEQLQCKWHTCLKQSR